MVFKRHFFIFFSLGFLLIPLVICQNQGNQVRADSHSLTNMDPINPGVLSPLGGAPFDPVWTLEVVDDVGPVTMFSNNTDIAVDDNGIPHIAYYDDVNDDLKYAVRVGSNWQSTIVDGPGNVGDFASLALDSNGYAHISYSDQTNDSLKYAHWDGGSWQVETIPGAGWGRFTAIAVDGNNRPHISYFDFVGFDLRYAHWNGASWQVQFVETSGWVGEYSSIALDSNDRPHISYANSEENSLKYARWDGAIWQIQEVDSGGHFYTSIALDSSDRAHIAAWTETGRNLKYARWDGATWQTEIVESSGWVGEFPAIALDSNDVPSISYSYGDLDNDLRIAYLNGNNWVINTLDTEGTVGGFTSLAIDVSDQIHISYYDFSNDQLKYALLGGFAALIPTSGGQIIVGDQFTTTVPPGTFAEDVYLTYTPLDPWVNRTDVDVYFELDAISADSGQPLQPNPGAGVDIEVTYEEENVPDCQDESLLTLFRWIPKTETAGSFVPVAGSSVDPFVNTVTATETELTIWAILGNCQELFLPVLQD